MTELSSQTINQTSISWWLWNWFISQIISSHWTGTTNPICQIWWWCVWSDVGNFKVWTPPCRMMCYEAHQIKFIHHPHHSFLHSSEMFRTRKENSFSFCLMNKEENLFVFVTWCSACQTCFVKVKLGRMDISRIYNAHQKEALETILWCRKHSWWETSAFWTLWSSETFVLCNIFVQLKPKKKTSGFNKNLSNFEPIWVHQIQAQAWQFFFDFELAFGNNKVIKIELIELLQ